MAPVSRPRIDGRRRKFEACPETWSSTQNVAWKVDVPGTGWSSPVVWGDRISSHVRAQLRVASRRRQRRPGISGGNRLTPPPGRAPLGFVFGCPDWKTGKILWEREVHKGAPKSSRHLKNSFASETPVTDGEHVYAYFGNVGIFCFDMTGKPVWSQTFGPYAMRYGWGTAASPVLYEGRIYIVDDNDDKSFLVALDKVTGKQIWRVERDEKSNWSTPYIWNNGLPY